MSAEYRDDGIINHVNACISPNAFDIFSAELLSYVDSAASDEISTSLPVEIQRKAIQDVYVSCIIHK